MGVVSRHRLNQRLEEVREQLLSVETVDGVTARKIVSDDTTMYYLEHKYASRGDFFTVS